MNYKFPNSWSDTQAERLIEAYSRLYPDRKAAEEAAAADAIFVESFFAVYKSPQRKATITIHVILMSLWAAILLATFFTGTNWEGFLGGIAFAIGFFTHAAILAQYLGVGRRDRLLLRYFKMIVDDGDSRPNSYQPTELASQM